MNTVGPFADTDGLLEVEGDDDDDHVEVIKQTPFVSKIKEEKNGLKSGLSQFKKFSVDSTTTGLDDLRTKAFDESWFAGSKSHITSYSNSKLKVINKNFQMIEY